MIKHGRHVRHNDTRGRAATSVELFTGAGGMALGLRAAGFHHLLVNELEPRACATLVANAAVDVAPGLFSLSDNFSVSEKAAPWPLIRGDVRDIDFTALAGQVDVVGGGVPCQPWSLGGVHRGWDDPRDLWPELFRCVREVRPRAVIAENVRGLLRPAFRPYYDYILRELGAPFERRVEGENWRDHDRRLVKAMRGGDSDATERYDVFRVPVNAADYGVPQIRHRVFVVALRRDLGMARWRPPAPTHAASPTHGLLPWRTLRDAIADLPEPLGDRQEHPDWLHHVGWPGARVYAGHTPNDLDAPAKTVKAGVHGVPGGETVLRRDDGSLRYLTVREVARLMTFPDHWRLAGPRGEQMRQLGNAVPVRLARVMARSVADALAVSCAADAR